MRKAGQGAKCALFLRRVEEILQVEWVPGVGAKHTGRQAQRFEVARIAACEHFEGNGPAGDPSRAVFSGSDGVVL